MDGLNIDSTYLNLLQESAAVSARPLSALLPRRRVLIIQLDDNYCLLRRSSSVAAVEELSEFRDQLRASHTVSED